MDYILTGLATILFLILLDLVASVALHLKKGDFKYKKLLGFLKTNVAPYLLIWGSLAAIPYIIRYVEIDSDVLVYFEGGVAVIWLIIVGNLVAEIFKKFKELNINIKQG